MASLKKNFLLTKKNMIHATDITATQISKTLFDMLTNFRLRSYKKEFWFSLTVCHSAGIAWHYTKPQSHTPRIKKQKVLENVYFCMIWLWCPDTNHKHERGRMLKRRLKVYATKMRFCQPGNKNELVRLESGCKASISFYRSNWSLIWMLQWQRNKLN